MESKSGSIIVGVVEFKITHIKVIKLYHMSFMFFLQKVFISKIYEHMIYYN